MLGDTIDPAHGRGEPINGAMRIDTGEATISVTSAGTGPGVLLLHGFPQSQRMWQVVASHLSDQFTVVCADLRGFGHSSTPPSSPDHEPYSKRAMARDAVAVMDALGFANFSIVGHDRGGRVAYRTALDHPDRIDAVAVLDVIPTDAAWTLADDRFALGFWPWILFAQPAPLPERLITGAPEAIIANALGPAWGTPATTFDADARAAYARVLSDPAHAHAICEEYRAAATIDRQHDTEDLSGGRRITCPLLALWSESGPLSTWYREQGGPVALWEQIADHVVGEPVAGGHFFPEEHPAALAQRLRAFLESNQR